VARAKLCLKARPTPVQLADRLRPVDGVAPDGLELFIDIAYIADASAVDGVVRRVQAHPLPKDFPLLIEGPVPSLDGQFFDVTRESAADRLVVERLVDLARRLEARAINLHPIAASADRAVLTLEHRAALLRRAVPFLRHFADLTRAAGAVPTIENLPPVLRMRTGACYFTAIGMASEDLRWLVDRVPGLAILPDTSHAGLYLNARRMAGQAGMERRGDTETRGGEDWEREWPSPDSPWLGPLLDYVRQLPDEPPELLGYLQS
jgi:sugar phosphate isomerase/epimerase